MRRHAGATRPNNTARLLILVGILIATSLFSPIIERFLPASHAFDLFTSFCLVATPHALRSQRRYLILSWILAVPLLLVLWYPPASMTSWQAGIGLISALLFFGFTGTSILYTVFISHSKVGREAIVAAVAVYLLIGITWSLVYHFLGFIEPGCLKGIEPDGRYQLVYFSFVTLTTLGYGDISPVTPLSQSLVVCEALFGQIYLVVLVAWLVGLNVAFATAGPGPVDAKSLASPGENG